MLSMRNVFVSTLVACLQLGYIFHEVSSDTAPRPHIIFIVADDLGWNDVSFHGSHQIPTPNLDQLAQDGIILNNHYVCPICTPSRGSLMTGLYPIHTGLQHDVIYADQPYGLPLSLKTLPQHLKTLNYATHAVGKWHLGFFTKEYTPTYRGFDSHLGYWGGKEDYYDHTNQQGELWGLDLHDNLTSIRAEYMKYSTQLYTDRAISIINDHPRPKPLFLYLAYQAVHSANSYSTLQAPPEYIGRFSNIHDKNRKTFAGMLSAMDDGIGAVVKALTQKDMLKNSIIVFTSDNGGAAAGFNSNAASNWPLRGVKWTLWEGGVRAAAMIWSPYLKNRGRVSSDLMHITDWLPTLYHAAGGQLEVLGNLDGYNMWNTLSFGTKNPRTEVLLNIDPVDNNSALIVGKYKIIGGLQYDGKWDGWYGPSGRPNASCSNFELNFVDSGIQLKSPAEIVCGPKPENVTTNCKPQENFCVFDLELDPCEYNNLASSMPDVRNRLLKRLYEYNATSVAIENKPADSRSDPKYHNYEWINWMDFVKT